MSHHATEDLSIMRALPGLTILAPASDFEAVASVDALVARAGCCYLRIERTGGFEDAGRERFQIGRARMLRDGDALTLIASGGIVGEALAAAEMLAAQGVECRVLSFHSLKPADVDAVADACSDTGGIVSIEENVLAGGLGSLLSEICMDHKLSPGHFLRFGVRDQYCKVVGGQAFLRRYNGIDAASIATNIAKSLNVMVAGNAV
jgi:transketolase